MSLKEFFVVIFVGFLLYLFAKHRNAHERGGASTTSPVAHQDALVLSLGFVSRADGTARQREVLPSPMEARTCGIMLAADYLGCDPGYAAAISPVNLGQSTSDEAPCFDPIYIEQGAVIPAGVTGPATVRRNIGRVGTAQNSTVTFDIPNTERI